MLNSLKGPKYILRCDLLGGGGGGVFDCTEIF